MTKNISTTDDKVVPISKREAARARADAATWAFIWSCLTVEQRAAYRYQQVARNRFMGALIQAGVSGKKARAVINNMREDVVAMRRLAAREPAPGDKVVRLADCGDRGAEARAVYRLAANAMDFLLPAELS